MKFQLNRPIIDLLATMDQNGNNIFVLYIVHFSLFLQCIRTIFCRAAHIYMHCEEYI